MLAEVSTLDTVRAFPTPEHIAFEYRLAGPAARAAAWIIDLLIRVGVFVTLAIPFSLLGVRMVEGLILVLVFALDWLAGGLCEWLWRGQTPGKRAVGIQVVGVDGLPAGFSACMLRNILRWADGLPMIGFIPTFAVGLTSLVVGGRFQRLGDLVAGTLVIYTERRLPPRLPPILDPAILALQQRLPPDAHAHVDGSIARSIAAFVVRRRQFHPRRRAEMAEHLARPLRRRLGLEETVNADHLLTAMYLFLFPPETATGGIAAVASRVLGRRRADWLRLEGLLAGEVPEVKESERPALLSRLYRAACTDLSLAGAYHLPMPNQQYLHALVAQAHVRFYRRVSASWRHLFRQIFLIVPARLSGDVCLRVAMLTFFGLFAICTLLGWQVDGLAASFVGGDALADLRDSFAEPLRGRDTVAGAKAGGFYIFNNVGIALSCFASGIFLGIGSLVWLAFNGIHLGLCFGHMAATGGSTARHFAEFVAAHGPFELTGIALAGAAGLRLGLGLVVRRGLPMTDSLIRSARESWPVAAVAAGLVALAAPIEGFVSPSALPVYAKIVLMALCLAVLVLYLVVLAFLGRRRLGGQGSDGEHPAGVLRAGGEP